MDPVQAFGTATIAAMVGNYALERRWRGFVLLFAVACAASSAYAVLIAAWPFAAAEAIWAGVALQRWWESEA